MVYGTYNELVFMGFINHRSITGGPHIVSVIYSLVSMLWDDSYLPGGSSHVQKSPSWSPHSGDFLTVGFLTTKWDDPSRGSSG